MVGSRDPLREALTAFVLACGLVAALGLVARGVPLLHDNLGAFAAVVFLYLPAVWLRRRGEHLEDYGFHAAPVGRGLLFAGGTMVVVFPLFVVAFVGFYDVVCAGGAHQALRALAPPGTCRGWRGLAGLGLPALGDGGELAVWIF